jgi:hypothetical protein
VISRLVELITKRKTSERRRKKVNKLVKHISKSEACEGERKVIYRLVEFRLESNTSGRIGKRKFAMNNICF